MIALLRLLTQCDNSDYDDVDEYGDDDNDDMTQWRNMQIRLVWLAFQVPGDVFFPVFVRMEKQKWELLNSNDGMGRADN